MKYLKLFEELYKVKFVTQSPMQRSFPGKKQTVELPSGKMLTGLVEKVDINTIVPIQDEDAVWNETSQGYAKGQFFNVDFETGWETVYDEGPIVTEDNLPPIVIDKYNKIVDGHHRWAALQTAGFKKINVIRYSSPITRHY